MKNGEKRSRLLWSSTHGYESGETLAQTIIDYARGKIAGYKRPKSIDFMRDEDMPRTATGKILHRLLRIRYGDVTQA